jgi:hypothetical protein
MRGERKILMIYYWEANTGNSCGEGKFSSDEEAIKVILSKVVDLLIIYKESDTENGWPYITVWERK